MNETRTFNTDGLELCREFIPTAEMIDYNGHLNVGWYGIVFEEAARALFPRLDISKAYRDRTQNSFFVVEQHQMFHQEVTQDERVSLLCRILGFDGRKLHLMYFMVKPNGALAATQETLYLHVDQVSRRVVAMADQHATHLHELKIRHERLESIADVGRGIRISSRKVAGLEAPASS